MSNEAREDVPDPDVILGYEHAVWCALVEADAAPEAMYVSLLRRRVGPGWKNLFSRDTPVAKALGF